MTEMYKGSINLFGYVFLLLLSDFIGVVFFVVIFPERLIYLFEKT